MRGTLAVIGIVLLLVIVAHVQREDASAVAADENASYANALPCGPCDDADDDRPAALVSADDDLAR